MTWGRRASSGADEFASPTAADRAALEGVLGSPRRHRRSAASAERAGATTPTNSGADGTTDGALAPAAPARDADRSARSGAASAVGRRVSAVLEDLSPPIVSPPPPRSASAELRARFAVRAVPLPAAAVAMEAAWAPAAWLEPACPATAACTPSAPAHPDPRDVAVPWRVVRSLARPPPRVAETLVALPPARLFIPTRDAVTETRAVARAAGALLLAAAPVHAFLPSKALPPRVAETLVALPPARPFIPARDAVTETRAVARAVGALLLAAAPVHAFLPSKALRRRSPPRGSQTHR